MTWKHLLKIKNYNLSKYNNYNYSMEALLKYSKQQVNNAGYIITGKKEANSEQQVEALKIIEDFRILHFKPTLSIRSFITGRLSKIGLLDNKNIIVQRLKKMSTLIDKIGKRKDKSIDDLYDTGYRWR